MKSRQKNAEQLQRSLIKLPAEKYDKKILSVVLFTSSGKHCLKNIVQTYYTEWRHSHLTLDESQQYLDLNKARAPRGIIGVSGSQGGKYYKCYLQHCEAVSEKFGTSFFRVEERVRRKLF